VAYASMGLATARFKTILDNFDGVRIEASSNIKILGNNITRSTGLQNSDGIYIDVSEGVTIQGNEISMVTYTIRIRGSQNNFIQNNNSKAMSSKAMSCLPVHQTTSYLTTKERARAFRKRFK